MMATFQLVFANLFSWANTSIRLRKIGTKCCRQVSISCMCVSPTSLDTYSSNMYRLAESVNIYSSFDWSEIQPWQEVEQVHTMASMAPLALPYLNTVAAWDATQSLPEHLEIVLRNFLLAFARVYTHKKTHACAHTHKHMHPHTRTHTCIRTHTHTHTHTNTSPFPWKNSGVQ